MASKAMAIDSKSGRPGRPPAELLLIAVFWSAAFVLTSVRGQVVGEMPFSLIAPHRAAIMLFGALLCWIMVHVLDEMPRQRFADRAAAAMGGALVMAALQSAFHWISCRVSPIEDIPPISLPETLNSALIALVYFIAWTWMHLALLYHREVEAARMRAPAAAAAMPQPVQEERLEQEFWVSRRRQMMRVRAEDILRVEAQKDYVEIHARGGGGMLRETMAAVEKWLDPDIFVRVHRSVIVRRSEIAGVRRKPSGALAMTLGDGSEVPVGRSYAKGLRALVDQLREA